jgi:hypothetical protein
MTVPKQYCAVLSDRLTSRYPVHASCDLYRLPKAISEKAGDAALRVLAARSAALPSIVQRHSFTRRPVTQLEAGPLGMPSALRISDVLNPRYRPG